MNLVIDLTASGDSAPYRTHGWSTPEPALTWTVGADSFLRLPGPPEPEPLILDLDVNPCLAPEMVSSQIFRVRVNGALVGCHRLTGLSRVRCSIDSALLRPGEPIDIGFEHPCFARTDLLDYSDDARPLAISFSAVRLFSPALRDEVDSAAPPPPYARLLDAPAPERSVTPHASHAASRQLYSFGLSGSANAFLRDGWHIDREGNTWSAALLSRIELPAPQHPGPYQLRISLCPLCVQNVVVRQRISVLLGGCVIGQFSLGTDTVLGLPLPAELLDGAELLQLAFVSPNAVPMQQFAGAVAGHRLGFTLDWIALDPVPPHLTPSLPPRSDELDGTQPIAVSESFLDEPLDILPAAVEARLGTTLVDMLRDFESLGDNCAFGLAQRKGGTEVLGLLRFANTSLKSLLRGFDDEFKATTQQLEITLYLHESEPREYMLSVERYGIRWHTMVHEADAEADTVFQQHVQKLGYLRRKFCEAVRAGRKIYIVVRADPCKFDVVMPFWDSALFYEEQPEPLRLAEALPVLTELNRSARNTLLYLVPCRDGRRSGAVELLAPGLMRGYLKTFVISDQVAVADHADWLRVVANAWLLEYGANASFRALPDHPAA